MILIDQALARREASGTPIRVGMIGAGFMGRGVARQLLLNVPGMTLSAVSSRQIDAAERVYTECGIDSTTRCASPADVEAAVAAGGFAVTEDALHLCAADNLDVLVDVTGAVEFGAQVALAGIQNGKHLCTMNVEVDATVGPALRRHADRAGVMLSVADGDQPGVQMNLYRYVKGMGFTPRLCGNIKGLQDPYRNPTTQADYARAHGQQAHMVTSFADGSKISFEQASVANALGFRVATRGMHGPTVDRGTPIGDCIDLYPQADLLSDPDGPGIVDYIVGAAPAPGVYVYATLDDPGQANYLAYYKMGPGPLYSFFHPYHLCHFEVANSIARMMEFEDLTLCPLPDMHVEVIAIAKRDLTAGDTLDGIGWYMTYGQCENADVVRRDRLLPLGVTEGCTLTRDVPKDQALRYDDVTLPKGRTIDQLRREMA